jgi:4-amino-4-deoxy-L-arabinose transferase-like glycosyltransferase
MGELSPGSARRPLWPLVVGALALALLPRLAIILSPRADLFGPLVGGEPNVEIGEEWTRGDVAMELLAGPLLSLGEYQYAHFFGGSLVVGIVAAPFFALFGPTLWALKLAALSFHLAALAAGLAILDRWVSRRAAWFFAALFALTPPGYTLLSTVAWGSHVESGALALLCTWLLLDLRSHASGSRARLIRRAILGVCAGFSLWFGYQCAIFLAALFAFELLADRRIGSWREAGLFALGALVGLAPWWVYNLRNDWAGAAIYGGSFVEHLAPASSAGALSDRVLELAVVALPGALFFPDLAGVPSAFWNGLGIVFLLCLACLPWFARARPRAAPFTIAWLALAGFAVAFCATDFPVGTTASDVRSWRYVQLPIPFLLLAAACGLGELARMPGRRAHAAWGLMLAWSVLALAGSSSFIDPARAFADRARLGASQEHFGRWMALRYAGEPSVLARLCERAMSRRTPEQQAEFFSGMATSLRNFERPMSAMNPAQRARAEHYRRGREWLAEHAPEDYRGLFQAGPASPLDPPDEQR